MHAVIRRHLFFAKHYDVVALVQFTRHQLLQEMVSHHAVTGDQQYGLVHIVFPLVRRRCGFTFCPAEQQRRRIRHRAAQPLQIKLRVAGVTVQQHAVQPAIAQQQAAVVLRLRILGVMHLIAVRRLHPAGAQHVDTADL
ncbi:hypothetical protein GGER_31460 [Serratia rubidaea]